MAFALLCMVFLGGMFIGIAGLVTGDRDIAIGGFMGGATLFALGSFITIMLVTEGEL